jgi:hypothetical protein
LRIAPVRRRRSVPFLLVGVVLVAGCGLAALLVSMRLGGRVPVLATAHAVPAGHVLAEADLRVVRVATDPGVGTVDAGDRGSVVGRTAAVPVPAGVLLTRSMLGASGWPPAGLAVVAVQVKAGQFPPELTAGAHVAVLTTAGTADATAGGAAPRLGRQPGGGPGGVAATVAGVSSAGAAGADTAGAVVVSLLLEAPDAYVVAQVPAGQVSLVLLAPGGGS